MTKMQLIKHHLTQLRDIVGTAPHSRDSSMVLTKADEMEMWAERNLDFHVKLPESKNEAG